MRTIGVVARAAMVTSVVAFLLAVLVKRPVPLRMRPSASVKDRLLKVKEWQPLIGSFLGAAIGFLALASVNLLSTCEQQRAVKSQKESSRSSARTIMAFETEALNEIAATCVQAIDTSKAQHKRVDLVLPPFDEQFFGYIKKY